MTKQEKINLKNYFDEVLNTSFILLDENTKKAEGFIYRFIYGKKKGYNDLYKCYAKPSIYKENAFRWCIDLVMKINRNLCGLSYNYDFTITGYNMMFFGFACLFKTSNNLYYLAYITKEYNYIIPITQNEKVKGYL